MTNEQILQLAETCGFTDANVYGDTYWECWEEELLKFARELYDKGKWEGYYDGYEMCSIDMGGEE